MVDSAIESNEAAAATAESTLDMPSLGADMEKARVVQWLVKPGQAVKRGDNLLQVESDKGLLDVEAFHDAVVLEILVPEGQTVPVGTPLARLKGAPQPRATAGPLPVAAEPSPPAPMPMVSGDEDRAAAPMARVRASPLARRRAGELGIDIATVTPGPSGRINVADVEQAAAVALLSQPRGAMPESMTRMRRAIAAAMAHSKREIPHYYASTSIDVTTTTSWLRRENERRPIERRLLLVALFARAVIRAARRVPELNGWWKDGAAVRAPAVRLCVATSLRGGGLVAPALADADADAGLDELMQAISDIVARARSGGLRASEMTEGTITLTSLGDKGAEELIPIIQPPQLAIVGVGRVVVRPWVVDGNIVARSVVRCTLAADHRATDGVVGSRFLAAIEDDLADPEGS